ncbi:asparagine synthase (glutamine-hydrolyzing) [Tsuneonella sp. SYSU-LHT278]|uniref:asparagine synthase (glutamine-hydrolyzing) n=1 Tax=Tsuneonella sediminis TaxID=3416089 RepID=UPI003F7B01EB
MCGISGLAGGTIDRARIGAMVEVQHHRGPDGSGVYLDPARRAALGHNRLSIIDLSDAGLQPMADASGRRWLAFNGEVYNFVELREELSGYPFTSASDSEVILAAYDRWGPACVERFIGMFAFAIWDEAEGTLFCARDRLGIKPFHYAQLGETFAFSSEIKALIAAGMAPRADLDTWGAYLEHGLYDHGEATFFVGVRTLPPGHTLTWRFGKTTIAPYWQLAQAAGAPLSLTDDEALERLDALITDAVRLRLRSDVPLGVNLSGGLDSSLLFAFVDQAEGAAADLNCFTAGFDDPKYDEAQFAEGLPRRRHWTQHIERLGAEQAWSLIDPLTRHEEAPFGGIATLAYYNLHRRIREEGVTVVLEGQGVDELFAGYAYYRQPAAAGVYQDGSRFLRPETLAPALRDRTPEPESAAPFPGTLANRLYRDVRHAKLPRVLRMNDRLSMAHSRELRVPFLDHRVVELAFRLDDDKKLRGDEGKAIMRRLLDRKLEGSYGSTPKRAVVTPQREWIRGPLREKIGDLIASQSFRTNGFFDPAEVDRAFAEYCAGDGDNAFFIWQWINVDAWLRAFRPAV